MSFQGDVGGIGLGELLQSLARGNREGILTLIGKNSLCSTLGLQEGQVHFLPEPDEDPEYWRMRARRAWADSDEPVDLMHMSEVARAARIETLYSLLDSDGAHFRFTPGTVPTVGMGGDGELASDSLEGIFCACMPVEFLLFEYARLSDEGEEFAEVELHLDMVPWVLDPDSAPEELARFLEECDGRSDVVEIADRLSLPLRQCRSTVIAQLQEGHLRPARAQELLALSRKELGRNQFQRAASRISAWLREAPPGPPSLGDSEMLSREWEAGRLPMALDFMSTPDARTLLKRLDCAGLHPAQALEHWKELAFRHPPDRLIELHTLRLQWLDDTDEKTPDLRDLLKVARTIRDGGNPRRAGVILRIAAGQPLETPGAQLEIGMGLLAGGLVEEGSPLILEAVTTYIENKEPEKALAPLRALLDADPLHTDARALMVKARTQTVRRRIVGKHSLVVMAIVLMLSGGAYVRMRSVREHDRKLDEVRVHMEDLQEARRLLNLYFEGDQSPSVAAIRQLLDESQRAQDAAKRAAWNDVFREAQQECNLGDPLLGLRRAIEMPTPPQLATNTEPWPLVSDLYNGLAARLEGRLEDLGPPEEENTEQIHEEEKIVSQIDDLQDMAREQPKDSHLEAFSERLEAVRDVVEERGETRAEMRAERLHKQNLTKQDMTLASARAHASAGDLERALEAYAALIELDQTEKLEDLLAGEVGAVKKQHDSVIEARRLAKLGRHAEARQLLRDNVERPETYLLPWRVESFPSGARTRLSDGSVHTTPFELQSTLGKRIHMHLTLDDHDPIDLEVDEPGNHFLYFSLSTERSWTSEDQHEIDAPPVSVGPDHIVADRGGNVLRLGADGEVRWETRHGSMGGMERAPIPLSKKPGHLLMLSAQGDAWILDAESGHLEGPWAVGSVPTAGPVAVQDGIVARFLDGRTLIWTNRLKPTHTFEAGDEAGRALDGALGKAVPGSDVGLRVLRREDSRDGRIESTWAPFVVEVEEDKYTVRDPETEEQLFTVDRVGEWQFVAWEAGRAGLRQGRLWISDGKGLRAFVPPAD